MTDTGNPTTDLSNASPAGSEAGQTRAGANSDGRDLDTGGHASHSVLAEHVAEIRRLGKRAIEDVIEIGRRLSECKKIVGHGNWLSWLEQEFGWSAATARNFMRVHELAQSNSANFADLNLPVSTLYLLAAPSTPEAARIKILERVGSGEQMTSSEVKQTIAKAKRAKAGLLEINNAENVAAQNLPLLDGHAADPGHGDDGPRERDYTSDGAEFQLDPASALTDPEQFLTELTAQWQSALGFRRAVANAPVDVRDKFHAEVVRVYREQDDEAKAVLSATSS